MQEWAHYTLIWSSCQANFEKKGDNSKIACWIKSQNGHKKTLLK